MEPEVHKTPIDKHGTFMPIYISVPRHNVGDGTANGTTPITPARIWSPSGTDTLGICGKFKIDIGSMVPSFHRLNIVAGGQSPTYGCNCGGTAPNGWGSECI